MLFGDWYILDCHFFPQNLIMTVLKSCFLLKTRLSLFYSDLLPSWVSSTVSMFRSFLKIAHMTDTFTSQCSGQDTWSPVFLWSPPDSPLHQILRSHRICTVEMVRVHICCGKLLPQMSSENPLSRSLCSLSENHLRSQGGTVKHLPLPPEHFLFDWEIPACVRCFAFAGVSQKLQNRREL